MNFDKKNVLPRFMVIVIPLTLLGISIIANAGYKMAAKKDYWTVIQKRMAAQQKSIPAERGNIYSADGHLLVGSLPEYTFHMDFKVVDAKDPKGAARIQAWRDSALRADLDAMCQGLHEVFPRRSAQYFKDKFEQGMRDSLRNLEFVHGASFAQYKRCLSLPYLSHPTVKSGFYTTTTPTRLRPFNDMAIRTLGTWGRDGLPQNGLELAFDSILRGKDGIKHREKVRNGWREKIDQQPINGQDIVTTIDTRLQDAAEKVLRRNLQKYDTEVGVVILMDVATGDVKAMSSLSRTASGSYEELTNNAIMDLWEPGSTFKTGSLMVGLEDGYITVDDSVHVGNGRLRMHGQWMTDHNANRGGYNKYLSLPMILMKSSNIGVSVLIEHYYEKQPEKFVDGLYRQGVGVPLGLPFVEAKDPRVERPLPDRSNWDKTKLPWMSIGYATMLPPIATLTFYNAIANNGKMVRPRFVTERRMGAEVLETYPVEVIREQICSPAVLHDVQQMLEMVVNHTEGLGKPARSKYFKICGKTGTAKVADGPKGYNSIPRKYMLSFCGYFPSEAPKYSCIACVKLRGGPASGGGVAGPIVRELAEIAMNNGAFLTPDKSADSTSVYIPAVLDGNLKAAGKALSQLGYNYQGVDTAQTVAYGVVHSGERSLMLQRGSEVDLFTVPDVCGMGARDAIALLERRGLQVTLQGQGRVLAQDIAPGTAAVKGEEIVLKLGRN